MSTYDSFAQAVRSYLSDDRLAQSKRDLLAYYDTNTPFSGSHFELIADTEEPDRITARDLLAVSMLGVTIPANVAIWILGGGASRISELLRQVPPDATIGGGERYLDPDGPLDELWRLLDTGCWPIATSGNGMGQTKKSKLLAAKRPALVPVVDSVVRKALPTVDSYWSAFSYAFDEDTMLRASIELRPRPPHVPVLRAFDVVVWQANRRRTDQRAKGGHENASG